jgi:putative tricarboxylic transport membrane protein
MPEMADGLNFVALSMGVFGLGEILRNLEHEHTRSVMVKHVSGLMLSKADFKRIIGPVLRGTALGSLLGILPGGGAMLASFAAYTMEKKALSGIRGGDADQVTRAATRAPRRAFPR